jgi:hypothetical protein
MTMHHTGTNHRAPTSLTVDADEQLGAAHIDVASLAEHLGAPVSAGRGRRYFTDGAVVVDDLQIDANARAYVALDADLRTLSRQDAGAAYRQALAIVTRELRQCAGPKLPAPDPADTRETIDDVEVDKRVKELVRTDPELRQLARTDKAAAYRKGLSRVASATHVAY